jgi:cytoskeletal protein RodZ
MATVAEQLRTAREAQKLTVHQIADITKIRTDHLRALEEGNFDVFMAPVYIKGFVRSYSTLLKLNVPQVMADLDAELRKTEKFAEPPRLSDEPRGVLDFVTLQLSKVNWRVASVVIGGLVVLALIYFGYSAIQSYRNRDPLKNLPPAVYKSTGKNSGDKLPLTNAPARSGR